MARLPSLVAAGAWMLCAVLAADPVAATQVWSGRTYFFSKAAFANPALPASQDRITPKVWLTRGSTRGLFNAFSEFGYGGNSPADTEWASGDAVNYGSLFFQPWVSWANGHPPSTVGVNAVVHLISEDIYIDIVFTSWAARSSGGGAFSYRRAVEPVTSTQRATWGRIKALYR